MKYYLAIDIGASSGRHILGWVEDGRLREEEIYRFENNLINKDDSLVWDIDNLVLQVKTGIQKCGQVGKIPHSVAIDTWGVDYVLLDEDKKEILPVYSYRDSRTDNAVKKVEALISEERLYQLTGIQKQNFNTIYQLYCDKESGRLDKAKYFMMIPAYLSYCLTGVIKNEYTNLTTMGMVNANSYNIDTEITQKLGINPEIFGDALMPGDVIGEFTDEMRDFAGFNAKVLFCPSHDTACAVAACPLEENDIYISSGTWSLIGTEIMTPVLTEQSRKANFTNEGGIEHRFRFLKNYMGMWLFQNIRRKLSKSLTYDEMMQQAIDSESYYYIDVNAKEFVAPDDMIQAIKDYLGKPDMPLGEVINSVYHSLARSYKEAIQEVEAISGVKSEVIHIVGGGCKDSYLNRLTAQYTGKKVLAGPVEATATGNLLSQLLADNSGYTLSNLRKLVIDSFNIEEVL